MQLNPQPRMGILVGGGPAPGINGVIHSATIEAINHGIEVIGIMDGFQHLMEGKLVTTPLTINSVSRIHQEGGSILRTSRANPAKSPESLRKVACALAEAGISLLVGIGGDDTAYSLHRVQQCSCDDMGLTVRTAHVPKTIDNDLPLPEGIPTFGFETAREVGSKIVMTFMEDALTSQNWFLVVTMGRKAGHLALGIGKSSGATLTIIPEEWRGRPIRLQEVVDILVTSILRRLADGKRYGVALIAEGVLEYLAPEDREYLVDIGERDPHGNVPLHDLNFSDILKRWAVEDLKKLGVKIGLRDKELGYELRCAPPIAYDVDYTRSLGEAAADFLINGGSGATISLQGNQVVPIPTDTIVNPVNGRIDVRMVNVDSFTYRSAYKFMIRLKPENGSDPMLLARLALLTNLSVDEFRRRYGYLIGIAERPAFDLRGQRSVAASGA
ncbi:MAG: 6-phosphofructokinase [Anaerolineae bacterium]|jgi:6-phosphofructokinase 1|nr:6-phosphofructokinase [Anaerolineae bacterium]